MDKGGLGGVGVGVGGAGGAGGGAGGGGGGAVGGGSMRRRGSLLWQHPEIPSTITEGAVLEVSLPPPFHCSLFLFHTILLS